MEIYRVFRFYTLGYIQYFSSANLVVTITDMYAG